MTTNRATALITIAALIIFGLAASIGILGLGGAFDHGQRRFLSTCQAPALPGSVVTVTLTNMGMSMMGGRGATMRLFPDQARVPAGTISFQAVNTGSLRHELAILPLADNAQPGDRKVQSDGTVDETGILGEASKSCAEGSGDGIAPGTVGWTSVNLSPGRYELICNRPGHYRAGMTTLLTVEAGP